jgi:6-phosphogluconolactonase
VYNINTTTGVLTAATTVIAGTNPNFLTADPSGKFLYVVNESDSSISVFTINLTTGGIQ